MCISVHVCVYIKWITFYYQSEDIFGKCWLVLVVWEQTPVLKGQVRVGGSCGGPVLPVDPFAPADMLDPPWDRQQIQFLSGLICQTSARHMQLSVIKSGLDSMNQTREQGEEFVFPPSLFASCLRRQLPSQLFLPSSSSLTHQRLPVMDHAIKVMHLHVWHQ